MNKSLYLRGTMWCFDGGSEVKASASNAGDLGSIPGLGRSPGEGNGQPTPVFLPGESHGGRSLVSYTQSMGSQRVGHDWATSLPQGNQKTKTNISEDILVSDIAIANSVPTQPCLTLFDLLDYSLPDSSVHEIF